MDERIRSTPPAIAAAAAGAVAARKTIQQIARRSVPGLADFAVVFIVTGRSIVGIASAHATSAGEKLLRDLRRVYRVRRDDLHSTVAQVVRTGRPSLRRSILHDNTSHPPRGSVADLHRRLACRSALVLPIRVGATVTGALTLCYAGSGRTYQPSNLAGALRIAREIEGTVPPPLPHGAPRLRAATGDARRQATVRRRVAPRN
jgi:GAF domain-containing protein